jgi:hypothetical protein
MWAPKFKKVSKRKGNEDVQVTIQELAGGTLAVGVGSGHWI